MATTWTIGIDRDRDGEFSGDDIVTERAVWLNWFLGFREPFNDIAQNSTLVRSLASIFLVEPTLRTMLTALRLRI